jgi:hypothetical protein
MKRSKTFICVVDLPSGPGNCDIIIGHFDNKTKFYVVTHAYRLYTKLFCQLCNFVREKIVNFTKEKKDSTLFVYFEENSRFDELLVKREIKDLLPSQVKIVSPRMYIKDHSQKVVEKKMLKISKDFVCEPKVFLSDVYYIALKLLMYHF